MGQVIEVRFMNPANMPMEELHDSFTVAKTHEVAINLAMHEWSGGVGVIKSTERLGDVQYVKAGVNSCWKYVYKCVVEDDEYDREMLAVLFAQYKERQAQ